jgi:hypothetical protein
MKILLGRELVLDGLGVEADEVPVGAGAERLQPVPTVVSVIKLFTDVVY